MRRFDNNRRKELADNIEVKTSKDATNMSTLPTRTNSTNRDRKQKAHPWAKLVKPAAPAAPAAQDPHDHAVEEDDDLSVVQLARAALGTFNDEEDLPSDDENPTACRRHSARQQWGVVNENGDNEAEYVKRIDSSMHDSALSEYTLTTFLEYDPTTKNAVINQKKNYTDNNECDMSACDVSIGFINHDPIPEHQKDENVTEESVVPSVVPSVANPRTLKPVLERLDTGGEVLYDDDGSEEDIIKELQNSTSFGGIQIKDGDDGTHSGESSRCSKTDSKSEAERTAEISCRVIEEVEAEVAHELAEEEAMMARQASLRQVESSERDTHHDMEDQSLALEDIVEPQPDQKADRRESSVSKKKKERKHHDAASKVGSVGSGSHATEEEPLSVEDYGDKAKRRDSSFSKKKKKKEQRTSDSSSKGGSSRRSSHEKDISDDKAERRRSSLEKEQKKKKKKDKKHSEVSSKDGSNRRSSHENEEELALEDVMDEEAVRKDHSSLEKKLKKKSKKDRKHSDIHSKEGSTRSGDHVKETGSTQSLGVEDILDHSQSDLAERRDSSFEKKHKKKKDRKKSDHLHSSKDGSSDSFVFEDAMNSSQGEKMGKRESTVSEKKKKKKKDKKKHNDISPKEAPPLTDNQVADEATPDFEDIMKDFYGEEADEIVSSSKKKKKKKKERKHPDSTALEDPYDYVVDRSQKVNITPDALEHDGLPVSQASDWNSHDFDEWSTCASVSPAVFNQKRTAGLKTVKTSSKGSHQSATEMKVKLRAPPEKPSIARMERRKDAGFGGQLFVVQTRGGESSPPETDHITRQQGRSTDVNGPSAHSDVSDLPDFFGAQDNDEIQDINDQRDQRISSKRQNKKMSRFVPKLTPMREEVSMHNASPALLKNKNEQFDMRVVKETMPLKTTEKSSKIYERTSQQLYQVNDGEESYKKSDESAIDNDGFFLDSDLYSVSSFPEEAPKPPKHRSTPILPESSRDSEKKNDSIDALTAERRGSTINKIRGSHEFY